MLTGVPLQAFAAGLPIKQVEELKVAVLSDTHYLSPDLIKDTDDFTHNMYSDRKMIAESDAFLTGLLNTLKEDKPEVLLISGDLTKDGETESHRALAAKLEEFKKKELPDLHIYVTAGNHDVNNSGAWNFNTADDTKVPAGRTSQETFLQTWNDLVYEDSSIVARFTPEEGKQGGGLSFAARPKDGFTVISIDTARYSADNTSSGRDEHETGGAIGTDLENWVLAQIADAKRRGDTVIGFEHHGMASHIGLGANDLPPTLLNDLIVDYSRIREGFVDAGLQYIFTGHMHANDIASYTTARGNTLYDIETGSVTTYPSPARVVNFKRTVEQGKVNETAAIKTYTGVNAGTFKHPQTGETITVDDISAYGQTRGFSYELISNVMNNMLHGFYWNMQQNGSKETIAKLIGSIIDGAKSGNMSLTDILGVINGGNSAMTVDQLIDEVIPGALPEKSEDATIYYDKEKQGIAINFNLNTKTKLELLLPNQGIKDTITTLFAKFDKEVLSDTSQLDRLISNFADELLKLPVTSDGSKTALDYANYLFQNQAAGYDSREFPEWMKEATAAVESRQMLDKVFTLAVKHVAGMLNLALDNTTFEELIGSKVWDNTNKKFIPTDPNRTPLIAGNDAAGKGGGLFVVLFGAKWKGGKLPDGTSVLNAPSGTSSVIANQEVGYSVSDFIRSLGNYVKVNFETILGDLLLGKAKAATDGGTVEMEKEGLISEKTKNDINAFLLKLTGAVGVDKNFAEDNNTTIASLWSLGTSTGALTESIASAESIDLSLYTDESAQAVTTALQKVRELRLAASQTEIDAALAELDKAVAGLVKPTPVDEGQTGDPTDNRTAEQTGNGNLPKTGDTGLFVVPIIALILGLTLIATAAATKRNKRISAILRKR